jgi:hypothetical protein
MSASNDTYFFQPNVDGVKFTVKRPACFTVRGASTANIPDLTAASTTFDGLTLAAGDTVLLKNQTTGAQNGIYGVTLVDGSEATLARIWPMEDDADGVSGTMVFVESGTANAKRIFKLDTAGDIVIGTTALTFGAVADSSGISNTAAQVNVPLALGILAAGTPLAAFADNASSNPGITLADSKAVAVRWNNAASQTAVWYSVALPQDVDDTADIVIHVLASKSGATVGDATTFTIAAYFQTPGALHDADTNAGGATGAMTGDATAKTVAELTRTIAAADVPASPSTLSFSINPTNSTLGTDDALVEGIWIEYTRKLSAS